MTNFLILRFNFKNFLVCLKVWSTITSQKVISNNLVKLAISLNFLLYLGQIFLLGVLGAATSVGLAKSLLNSNVEVYLLIIFILKEGIHIKSEKLLPKINLQPMIFS